MDVVKRKTLTLECTLDMNEGDSTIYTTFHGPNDEVITSSITKGRVSNHQTAVQNELYDELLALFTKVLP